MLNGGMGWEKGAMYVGLASNAMGVHAVIGLDWGVVYAEGGRYHLYISYACPWASRCLAVLNMKVGTV